MSWLFRNFFNDSESLLSISKSFWASSFSAFGILAFYVRFPFVLRSFFVHSFIE